MGWSDIEPLEGGAMAEAEAHTQAEMEAEARRFARVKAAVMKAWAECGEVPFPLYEREAERIAAAVIAVLDEAPGA